MKEKKLQINYTHFLSTSDKVKSVSINNIVPALKKYYINLNITFYKFLFTSIFASDWH